MIYHTEEEINKELDEKLVSRWLIGVYLFAFIMGMFYL